MADKMSVEEAAKVGVSLIFLRLGLRHEEFVRQGQCTSKELSYEPSLLHSPHDGMFETPPFGFIFLLQNT